jgi:hypothetical protein
MIELVSKYMPTDVWSYLPQWLENLDLKPFLANGYNKVIVEQISMGTRVKV